MMAGGFDAGPVPLPHPPKKPAPPNTGSAGLLLWCFSMRCAVLAGMGYRRFCSSWSSWALSSWGSLSPNLA